MGTIAAEPVQPLPEAIAPVVLRKTFYSETVKRGRDRRLETVQSN